MDGTEEQIEIVLDEPNKTESVKDETVVVVDDEPQKKASDKQYETPEEALAKMEKKLKRQEKEKEKAEYAREVAERRADQLQQETIESRKYVASAAYNQLKTENDILNAKYAEAMSISDYDGAAKLNQQLVMNANKMLQIENDLERTKYAQQERPASEIDQIIKSVSRESADWIKQHKTELDDVRMIRKMFRAHEDAVDDGIKPDTDEYFEYIEGRLGLNESKPAPRRSREAEVDADEPMSAASKPTPRQAPPPPAPVERYGSRPNVVRLTRAEAETAQMLGMTEKEYAKHKIALQKEGKLPH